MSLFLGLDIGTSGGRCLIVDDRGRRVGQGSRPWTYRQDAPGMCELDPSVAWTALVEAARDALASADAGDVAGIGVTSQRTGVVLLDEKGAELHAGPNADGRGIGAGIELERDHGDLVYRTTGRLPIMLYLPARLAWFRTSSPEVATRVSLALSFSDWAVFRLTGEAGTDTTQAAEMLVYDLAEGAWSDELCSVLDVPPHLLPPIRDPGSPTGSLTAEAAAEFGLPEGLPTVAGGSDTQAASLAMGVTEPRRAVVVAGSTMLCQQPVSDPVIDTERRLWTSPHLSGGFVVEAHCGESGVPLDWMASLMRETHDWLDEAASGAEAGAGGVVFADPAPSRVGDFPLMRTGGLTFPAPLLALGRSREDVARATLEGIAFAAAAGLEWTRDVAGPAEDVAVTGGVARSRTFVRILATAIGRPVRAATEANGSALGAAMLASVGAGAHHTVGQAVDAMADRGEQIAPEETWAAGTATAFAAWRERIQRIEETTMRVSHMIGAG